MIADYELRKRYTDAEWILNPEIFQKAIKHQKFKPDLYCFASRLNTRLPQYISYKPNPYTHLMPKNILMPFQFIGDSTNAI